MPEDIEHVNYLLGLDFGHGETTLAYWKFNGLGLGSETPIDLKFDTKHGEPKKLFSAIYINKDGEYILQPSNASVPDCPFYIGFKRKPERLLSGECYPGDNKTYRELVQIFIRKAIECVRKAEKDNPKVDITGNGILAIGCPSSEEWLAYAKEYAQIITEGIQECGLNLTVIIMPESRASILKVYHQNINDKYQGKGLKEILQRGAVVFDFGSSTLDVTFVNFNTNIMWDDSIPLGASLIEEMMLDKTLENNGRKEDDLTNVSQSKLSIRQAKENYFSTSEKVKLYLNTKDDDDIRLVVNEAFVKSCVNAIQTGYNSKIGPVVGTWEQLACQFMKTSKKTWQEKNDAKEFDGVIMLTGGASNMKFIKELATNIFPNAKNISDDDPSYCVSRGLIYALNTDLLSTILFEKILEEIKRVLPQQIDYFRDTTGKNLSVFIYEHLKTAMENWVTNGDGVTFNQMVKDTSNDLMTQCYSKIELIIRNSLDEFITDNKKGALRSTVAKIVMDTYEEMFPGKITAENMIFQIPTDFWENDQLNSNTIDIGTDAIISTLDLDSALKTGTIVVLLIPIIILGLTLTMIDKLLGLDLASQLDKLLQSNGNKIYNQEQRQDCVDRLLQRKKRTIDTIYKNVKKSLLPTGKPEEEKFTNQIFDIVIPVVKKSINQISLYF